MVRAVLDKFQTPPDIALQVSDMVREAVDRALRQLTANGGGDVQQPQGYTHPARTAEEVRATVADESMGVPSTQRAETDGMPEDLAAIVNEVKGFPGYKGDKSKIVIPKKCRDGWAF